MMTNPGPQTLVKRPSVNMTPLYVSAENIDALGKEEEHQQRNGRVDDPVEDHDGHG